MEIENKNRKTCIYMYFYSSLFSISIYCDICWYGLLQAEGQLDNQWQDGVATTSLPWWTQWKLSELQT